jgi:Flp pilus assembly protein TadD
MAAAGVFAVVLASFAFGTLLRNAVWADPIRLWQESVDLAPTHPRPRLLLGEALEDAGLRDEALAEYWKAIDLRPADPAGHLKAGHLLAALGRWAEARRHFVEALELDPHNPAADHSLALLDEIASRFGIDNRRP